MCWIKKQFNMT